MYGSHAYPPAVDSLDSLARFLAVHQAARDESQLLAAKHLASQRGEKMSSYQHSSNSQPINEIVIRAVEPDDFMGDYPCSNPHG